MKIGDKRTRVQVTAKVYVTFPGENGYRNLGDCEGYKNTISRQGADVLLAEKGYHRKIRNLTSEIGDEYELKPRETFDPTICLALMGTRGADTTQALVTAPSGTASFSGVLQGRSYFLGKLNVNTEVVQVSAVTKTKDVDYTIDYGTGELRIIPAGGIADAANVSVTFGCALVVQENYTTLDKCGTQEGACRIDLFDQHDTAGIPLESHAFTGQFWMEGGFGDQDGKKPAVGTLKILAVTKPVVTRAAA